MNKEKSEKIFQQTCKLGHLTEAYIYAENLKGDISWNSCYNRTLDSPMILASITKLFVTTCILQLVEQGKLKLTDPISQYLDLKIIQGIHVYKGVDYSESLTLAHLLFQTSGLPDYYLVKGPDGTSFEKRLWKEDFSVTFDEMVQLAKKMKPVFEPERKGRAYYADINFDLMGKIIENQYQKSLPEVYEQQIFSPLGLVNTFVLSDKHPHAPAAYKNGKPHTVDQFLRSFPASGGGVTTAREFMVFLKAFWTGKLFSKELWDNLKEHNRLQFGYGSVNYSGGHMYIHEGYAFTKKNTLRGHSGSSGSFAYYCEETGMFYVGDLNDPRVYLPVNMLLRIEYQCR